MSNSRLEKFIYAICGMEVDDLPTPLSRIETLWNCLISGETPDFEPLSRNETYLMSMLTGDVDALPEPTSRSEKLLYKIATGETDLTDVPGYLSRYEELLKHLIENGGIGGTDFEYVLYTLNQPLSTLYTTAEGPVKSAILKGNTLVNLFDGHALFSAPNVVTTYDEGVYTFQANEAYEGAIVPSNIMTLKTTHKLELNKKYTFFVTQLSGNPCQFGVQSMEVGNKNSTNQNILEPQTHDNRIHKFTFTLTSDYSELRLRLNTYQTTQRSIQFKEIMIIEGDYTNVDIPYFTGMQSVKLPVLTTTGKNLFDIDSVSIKGNVVIKNNTITITPNGTWKNQAITTISVNCGEAYVLSFNNGVDNSNTGSIKIYDGESVEDILIAQSTSGVSGGKVLKFTPNTNKIKVVIEQYGSNGIFIMSDIQIEKGSVATPYEPYKSNILSTPSDLVLRGIGDVKDTLNVNSGEVVEKTKQIVNHTTTGGMSRHMLTNETYFVATLPSIFTGSIENLWNNSALVCDKIPTKRDAGNSFCIYTAGQTPVISVPIATIGGDSLELFKQWYVNLSPSYVYKLATPVVKTVVLSTLDQDGQPTKLSTFNDITHVSIEAEDLLPTIDLEVATKIEEMLSSLPTQMIDISETQHSLNEKIDEQAENIKEVSAAMTEIHNHIL